MEHEGEVPRHHPVFVGGCQRSGTTILGRLIGQHSRYTSINEVQFHTNPGGLSDLLEGHVDLAYFVDRLEHFWWRRTFKARRGPEVRGLFQFVEETDFRHGLANFQARFPEDPIGASRELITELLDPVARRAGTPSWVEATPTTGAAASVLHRLFPDMKLIHTVRDGRDVACSVMGFPWGPQSVTEGVRWWADHLREAEVATRRIPADRVLVLSFEDLVEDNRDNAYRRLLQFLDIEDELAMHWFFSSEVSAERAHLGRWRSEIAGSDRQALRTYREVLAELHRAGVTPAPPTPEAVTSNFARM